MNVVFEFFECIQLFLQQESEDVVEIKQHQYQKGEILGREQEYFYH